MVADPDDRGFVSLWVAYHFCIRFWRWAVYLHSVLGQPSISFARFFALAQSFSGKLGVIHRSPRIALPLTELRARVANLRTSGSLITAWTTFARYIGPESVAKLDIGGGVYALSLGVRLRGLPSLGAIDMRSACFGCSIEVMKP